MDRGIVMDYDGTIKLSRFYDYYPFFSIYGCNCQKGGGVALDVSLSQV